MNFLCIFYLKVTPHTHPPCTWIYAHPSKIVHSLTSQKIPVAIVTGTKKVLVMVLGMPVQRIIIVH